MGRKRWHTIPALVMAIAVSLCAAAYGSDKGEDMLDLVNTQGVNNDTKTKVDQFIGVFNSVYTKFYFGSVILITSALVLAFIRMAYSSGRGRDMAKDWIIRICLAAILIGAAAAIVTMLVQTGNSM